MLRLLICLYALSCSFALHSEEKALLSVSIPNIAQFCEKFKQHPLGKTLWGEDLAALRAYAEGLVQAESPDLYAIAQKIQRVDIEVLPTGDKNQPVGIRLQFSGDFGIIDEALQQTIKSELAIPNAQYSFEGTRILISKISEHKSFQAINNGGDMEGHWNIDAIREIVLANAPKRELASITAGLSFAPSGFFSLLVNADKLSSQIQLDAVPAGSKAIDLSILKRIPETSEGFAIAGFNGGDWWKAHKDAIATIVAENMIRKSDPESIEMAMNQINGMATMFLGTDVDTLMNGINGSFAMILNEPIITYPNISLLMPRSPALDTLITQVLNMGQQKTPEPGSFEFLNLKNMNPQGGDLTIGAICIARDDSHWILSMDSQFTEDYLSGKQYDISKRHYADTITEPDTLMYLAAMNSNKGMMLAVPHALGTAGNFFDNGRHAPAMAMAGHKLIKHSSPMIGYARSNDNGYCINNEGISSFAPSYVAVAAIVASIAIPNLLESKITANEAAAAATLKSAFFAGLIQFQAGCYLDIDNNGVGEYGFINHMNGAKPIKSANGDITIEAGSLMLLTGNLGQEVWPDGYATSNGYHFKIFLPDGRGGMYGYDEYAKDNDKASGASLRENYYIAVAWPTVLNETGRRVYMMTQDGQLRSTSRIQTRSEFMDNPSWEHFFKGVEGTMEEKLRRGPNTDAWPYYSR